jgi:hypothetical protein
MTKTNKVEFDAPHATLRGTLHANGVTIDWNAGTVDPTGEAMAVGRLDATNRRYRVVAQ